MTALYTFYFCREGGDAISFETFELRDDEEARARAGLMLRSHASCDYVAAWQGNRKVCTRHRLPASLAFLDRDHDTNPGGASDQRSGPLPPKPSGGRRLLRRWGPAPPAFGQCTAMSGTE
jgi:hypothetical protein